MLKSSSTYSLSLRNITLTINSTSALVISIKIVILFELLKIRKLVSIATLTGSDGMKQYQRYDLRVFKYPIFVYVIPSLIFFMEK